MATQQKCTSCGEWSTEVDRCTHCSAPRKVHSTFANHQNPERFNAFEMPEMEWNRDPNLPGWKRTLVNVGRIANWTVLAIGGLFAWMAYWVAV
jgi:hypothetical protein